MPNKNHLTLYIDNDLINIAKSSNMNLSQEFEEWLRIRFNQITEEKPMIDVEKEIAKHQVEIEQLKKQKDIKQQEVEKETAENNSLDIIIDNIIKSKEDLNNLEESRLHGIQFIMKRRYHKELNPLQAKELLIKRLKERGLLHE